MTTPSAPRTLADLKVGDEVCIDPDGFPTLGTIGKITPKTISIGWFYFNRETGAHRGAPKNWRLSFDPKDLARARTRHTIKQAEIDNLNKLSAERSALHARRQAAMERVRRYVEARTDQPDEIHVWHDERLLGSDIRELLGMLS